MNRWLVDLVFYNYCCDTFQNIVFSLYIDYLELIIFPFFLVGWMVGLITLCRYQDQLQHPPTSASPQPCQPKPRLSMGSL